MTHRDSDIAYARCPCGKRMTPGDYLCPSCRQATARMKIVAKARFRPPREGSVNTTHHLCDRCPKLEECRECARDGRVLACEAADERDVAGVRIT